MAMLYVTLFLTSCPYFVYFTTDVDPGENQDEGNVPKILLFIRYMHKTTVTVFEILNLFRLDLRTRVDDQSKIAFVSVNKK